MKIAGAILAGGQAKRLNGRIKGEILLPNGQTIIEKIIGEFFQANIIDIFISANIKEHYLKYNKEIISDLFVNAGPLAGIQSVLLKTNADYDAVLFMPCDLPNVSSRVINDLVCEYNKSKNKIVFAKSGNDIWHPLCVIVNCKMVDQITDAIVNGEHRLRDLWKKLDGKSVLFDDEAPFVNLNTMEDLQKYEVN